MPHVGSVFLSSPISAARNSCHLTAVHQAGLTDLGGTGPLGHRLLEGDVVSVCFSLRALPASGKEIDNKGLGNPPHLDSFLLHFIFIPADSSCILSTWMGWHAFLPLKLSSFVNYFVRNLPGGLVVRTLHFHFRGMGSRNWVLQITWWGQKRRLKKMTLWEKSKVMKEIS